MAEDPKIVPDGPPWEPRDVEIVPDGPPWQPHDVQVSPDAAPWDPIEVPLYPDLPPTDPFQVPTYLDGPPWEPHDVPLTLDGPPADPFQVPTYPDGPPWTPVDVQVVPDGPPWVPTDVQTYLDPAPWTPTDVQVVLDAPPRAPVDVPVVLDGQPWQPVDVPINRDQPSVLATGLQVRDHRLPPRYEPRQDVDVPALVSSLRKYDKELGDFLEGVGEVVPFVSIIGKGAFDPIILADWLGNYTRAVGAGGMARFLEEQAALYILNPSVARIFDPLYFERLLIPGGTGLFKTTIDDETETQDFSVDEMVEARTAGVVPRTPPYMREDRETGVARFDATKHFEYKTSPQALAQSLTGIGTKDIKNTKLAKSAATHGIIRVPVPGDGEPKPGGTVSYDGVVLSDTVKPNIDDDEVRLPLCFTDLRKDPASDAYRHVFFQPLNLVVNQSFSPQYNETQAFGRVDQMVGYVGTARTWSVSFDVHAFAPEDVAAMYHKMTWLTSMVYPTYGSDALMRSGPVCRMRIGDLAATSEGGVPGVIRSLSFDFAECLWELKRGMKVPRSFGVQVDYTVLHDGPVGLLNGMFGVIQLPSGPKTNLAGPSAPNQESTDPSNTNSVSIAGGRWAKFGEPTRKG